VSKYSVRHLHCFTAITTGECAFTCTHCALAPFLCIVILLYKQHPAFVATVAVLACLGGQAIMNRCWRMYARRTTTTADVPAEQHADQLSETGGSTAVPAAEHNGGTVAQQLVEDDDDVGSDVDRDVADDFEVVPPDASSQQLAAAQQRIAVLEQSNAGLNVQLDSATKAIGALELRAVRAEHQLLVELRKSTN
jgi:hypothetical protein